MGSNLTIGACYIVRDEQDNIVDSILSIKDHVDEILILDTGSTDSTTSLLESLNFDKIALYKTTWKNSFSEARNEAIEHCKSDWIIVVDADEVVVNIGEESLKTLVLNHLYSDNGYLLGCPEIRSETKKISSNIRIFPNNKLHFYVGRVHEYVFPHETDSVNIPLEIVHSGYTSVEIYKRNKETRNLNLLEMQLKETPHESRWKYYYHLYTFDKIPFDTKLQEIQKDLSIFKGIYKKGLYSLLMNIYLENGNISELTKCINCCLVDFPQHFDALFFKELMSFIENPEIGSKLRIEELIAEQDVCDFCILTKSYCRSLVDSIAPSDLVEPL